MSADAKTHESAGATESPDEAAVLRVVPMDPSMAAALERFHDGLSAATTRNRFFGVHPHLSAAELTRFTTVDHTDREAFVVLDGADIVAVARFDRLAPGADAAEVAFVVADAWQRHGLATDLLRRLVDRARALGITRLVADTLASNRPMQAVFHHAGLPCTTAFEHGVVHITIEVAQPAPAAPSDPSDRAARVLSPQ